MNDKPVRIVLGGHLGKLFGAEWNLYVQSPAEAIRAIDINLKGKLRAYLVGEGGKKYYKIALKRKDNLLTKEELNNPSGCNDIYILPTVKGNNSGWAKVIVGVVLAVVTYGASTYFSAAYAGFAGAIGTSAAGLTAIGYGLAASMILGGITQLLTPNPSFNNQLGSEGDSRGSNTFQGNSQVVTQGGAVGLVYGRALVSPMPVSLSITSYDQSAPNSFAPGTYTIVYGPGGIVEYVPIPVEPIENLPEN